MVTGASGLLGSVLVAQLASRGMTVHAIENRHDISFAGDVHVARGDLSNAAWAKDIIHSRAPDIIVHCAGLANVDGCEQDPGYAQRIHVDVSAQLARSSRDVGARFLHISTDHLWRGDKALVREDEPLTPINVYGRTKADAETRVLAANPAALVVRTNFFCRGLQWRASFTDWAEQQLRSGKRFTAFSDSFFTPIDAGLLCEALIELASIDVHGILHVCGSERLSKYDFVCRLAKHLSIDAALVKPGLIEDANLAAPRPSDMSLATGRVSALLGRPMPDVEQSLASLLNKTHVFE